MNVFTILRLLPTILSLVTLVETFIKQTKQGQVKKELVLEVLDGLASVAAASKVITIEEWNEIKPLLSEIIDSVVAALNALGVFKKGV